MNLLSFLNTNRIVNGLALLAGLFLLLAIFSNFSAYAFDVYFNSDTLYLPSVYKDIFIDKNYIKDWHLNPAPNFFPDMLLYFTMLFFSSGNFIAVSFIFSIIQFFAILLLFGYILKLVMPLNHAGYFRLVFILFSFFILEYLFLGNDFMFTFYVLSNSYHTGAFVMSLIAIILFFKSINDHNKTRISFLFMLSVICVASDKLFIVLFSLPAFFTVAFFYKKIGVKTSLIYIAILVFSVFIGIKLFEFLEDSDFTEFDKPHRILSFENIKSSFDMLFQQVKIYMSEFSFKGMTLYLFFAGLLVRSILFFQIRSSSNPTLCIYIFFSICFDIIVFFAPVANGSYTGFDTLRYNIYPLYFSAVNNTVVIAYFVGNSKLKRYSMIGKSGLTFVVILLFYAGMNSFSSKGLKKYFAYYPQTVQQIDAIAKVNNLKCGVSDYWLAKKTTQFSRNNLKVYSVFSDLGAYEHVTNRKWFFSDNNIFNYVIINKLSDTLFFKRYFSSIQIIKLSSDNYVVKTPEFKYDRNIGYKPIVTVK